MRTHVDSLLTCNFESASMKPVNDTFIAEFWSLLHQRIVSLNCVEELVDPLSSVIIWTDADSDLFLAKPLWRSKLCSRILTQL